MTDAEKYFLSFGDKLKWTLLTTTVGQHICSRVVQLGHDDKYGFWIGTKTIYRKIGQIEKNPLVTLSIGLEDAYTNPVAHCLARVTDEKEILDHFWNDGFKAVGYTGRDDPRFRIILFTVISVENGTEVHKGTEVDLSKIHVDRSIAPPPFTGTVDNAKILHIIEEGLQENINFHLFTWKGEWPVERYMETQVNKDLGMYHMTTRTTSKLGQIKANPHVCLLLELRKTNKQLVIDAEATVHDDPTTRKQAWIPKFQQYGFKDAEDKNWVVITYKINTLTIHDMSKLDLEVIGGDGAK